MDLKALIVKYSRPGPRYTSYPTAPQWTEEVNAEAFERKLIGSDFEKPQSLYVHIPFCESLCYYCGCNIQISSDHSVEGPFVDSLIGELRWYRKRLSKKPILDQISFGGGTPSFLSIEAIQKLFFNIHESFQISETAEINVEVDPRVTSDEQLVCFRKLGFNRISLGVQDFNEEVQTAVNRLQSAESTHKMLERARELGFGGVNFDLMYGLPFQTLGSFEKTIKQVIQMRPDRIALYNYARLPEMIPHQKILEKYPMPEADTRVEIFTSAFDSLTEAGYQAIGMDHFALESDELFQALRKGSLYRNFMGYTVKKGTQLIGIGPSAISELETGYFQNQKKMKDYQATISSGQPAQFRGCVLSAEDLERKWIIQSILCRFFLSFADYEVRFGRSFEGAYGEELDQLADFFNEGLLEKSSEGVYVTALGRLFVRNVAMVFDAYLKKPQKVRFSKTV